MFFGISRSRNIFLFFLKKTYEMIFELINDLHL